MEPMELQLDPPLMTVIDRQTNPRACAWGKYIIRALCSVANDLGSRLEAQASMKKCMYLVSGYLTDSADVKLITQNKGQGE